MQVPSLNTATEMMFADLVVVLRYLPSLGVDPATGRRARLTAPLALSSRPPSLSTPSDPLHGCVLAVSMEVELGCTTPASDTPPANASDTAYCPCAAPWAEQSPLDVPATPLDVLPLAPSVMPSSFNATQAQGSCANLTQRVDVGMSSLLLAQVGVVPMGMQGQHTTVAQ